MGLRTVVAIAATVTFVACVANRYERNIVHLYITRWTHIPRADVQRIVALVSQATPQPIVGLTQDRGREKEVFVCTCWPDEKHAAEDVCTGFRLHKTSDDWHIVFRGSMSRIVVGLTLSNP